MKKFYYKPARVKLIRMAETHSSDELVTPCRLLVILVLSCLLIGGISFSVIKNNEDKEDDKGEINLSTQPYFFDFKSALRTREENLEFYKRPSNMWAVDKRHSLEVEEFWDIYDGKWPVVITDVVPKWAAYNWSKEFLINQYGKDRVTFKAIIDGEQHLTGHIRPLEFFVSTLDHSSSNTWNYMEDEMFILRRPKLQRDIGENKYGTENFFSLFPEEIRPWDSAFLWGAKHSRSTLHMDPYNWTAVSSVIRGAKRWKLFIPGQDEFLYVEKNVCGFPLECKKYNSPIDAFNADLHRYHKFEGAQYLEVDVYAGEMLIIPTGWFHQAYNLEETMAVSSQIMNRNNYLVILEEIIKGGNLKRRKLPDHFNTLMPPDQVKLFLSYISKKVIKRGKELTEMVHNMVSDLNET